MQRLIFLTSCILVMALSLVPSAALSVQLLTQPQSLATPQPSPFTVSVVIDTQGENINTVEGVAQIDVALGDVITVTDSGSIITYWVKRPTWDAKSRTVAFSGAVPGGYQGSTGILFSMVLPAYSGGQLTSAATLSNIKVYRNDGLGTQAQVSAKSFGISQEITPASEVVTDQLYIGEDKKDNIPPEEFTPNISRDDRVYDGKWFITFSTQDKQSGIDHYEIQETRSSRIDAGRWKRAESPYLLEDQALHSYVYIIAIDRQGNERVMKIYPRYPLRWFQLYETEIIAAGVVAVTLATTFFILRRRRQQNRYTTK